MPASENTPGVLSAGRLPARAPADRPARDRHRLGDLDSLLGRPRAAVGLVDPAHVRRLARERPGSAFLCELVELFTTDTSERVGTMRGAVEQGDVPLLRAQAHAVRGAGVMLGAVGLIGICAELERPRGAEIGADAEALIDRLEWTLARSAAELRALVCD